MNYNEVENALNYTGKALYNGNISETYWRTSSDDVKRKYSYQYDKLNRLKNAIYQRPENSSPLRNSYNESLIYDKNGNIKGLWRNGDLDTNDFAIEIDDLTYTYHPANPNQLMKVLDSSNHPEGFKDDSNGITDADDDYEYDDFGNLKKDQNKQITFITYNHLNLPISIVFAGGKSISYLYNAVGQKVKKVVYEQPYTLQTVTTDYMDGFQYTEGYLSFFPHAEGYVSVIYGRGGIKYFNYAYQYKDHLGNVRLSFAKNSSLDIENPSLVTILEENHYYPYGLRHTSYNTSLYGFVEVENGNDYYVNIEPIPTDNWVYKYRYNGQEWQNELGLNMTAMDYRQYDNALGRFNSVDAMAEMMPDITGYHFGFNNPVYWADPSGLKPSSNMSALQLANTAFSNTEEGTNSYWVNDGVGNFDYAGDGFGGGSSNLAGSFINNYGEFQSGVGGGGTNYENGSYVVYNGNPDAGLLHTVVVQAYKSKGVGQPKGWETAIPVWGSGRAAYDHFQNGNYWRGIGYSALALSDLFLVKSAVTAIGKGIAVGVSKVAANRVTRGRAFWSGAGSEARALEEGFGTLGQTRAGQNLIKLTEGMPYYPAMNGQPASQAYQWWARLSTQYAKGASGTVHVFQNAQQGVGMQSIWRLYEYPTLLKNPNVTGIIFH